MGKEKIKGKKNKQIGIQNIKTKKSRNKYHTKMSKKPFLLYV